jgi:hypothetical protein
VTVPSWRLCDWRDRHARQASNPTAPSITRHNGTPAIAAQVRADSAPDPRSDSVAWSFHSRGDGQPHSHRWPRGPRGGRHSARQRRRLRRLSDNPWLVRDQEKEQRSARGRARRRSLLRSSFTASLISPGLRPANHARSPPARTSLFRENGAIVHVTRRNAHLAVTPWLNRKLPGAGPKSDGQFCKLSLLFACLRRSDDSRAPSSCVCAAQPHTHQRILLQPRIRHCVCSLRTQCWPSCRLAS